jgi:hypothetical protein
MKLGKSATETLEILCEAFGEHSLSRTMVFEWHSCFKASCVSVDDDKCSRQPAPAKQQKMLFVPQLFDKCSKAAAYKHVLSYERRLTRTQLLSLGS